MFRRGPILPHLLTFSRGSFSGPTLAPPATATTTMWLPPVSPTYRTSPSSGYEILPAMRPRSHAYTQQPSPPVQSNQSMYMAQSPFVQQPQPQPPQAPNMQETAVAPYGLEIQHARSHSGNVPERLRNVCREPQCSRKASFSSNSNLTRHYKEKHRGLKPHVCPHCQATFTRSSARNLHYAEKRCTKRRRSPAAPEK